ncbi:MAG: hypothetical protein M1834_006164 [Cirrosporium novae-zelandiae]|nr:MAG: hypothetical protein M1834_006164 [Cirrosporium novae-zelandiae]
MFAHCDEPIWQIDDFSFCFEHDYLQILFPLIACVASLLVLSVQIARRIIRDRQIAYHAIPQDELIYGVPSHTQDDALTIDDDATAEDDEDDLSQLILHQTKSQGYVSTLTVDRPKGEKLVVLIELLAALAEVGIGIAALMTHAWGKKDQQVAIAEVATWGYIAAIIFCRLLLTISTQYSFPKLWRHTAFLYACRWLSIVLVFRSEIIHPVSRLAQIFTISSFALATLLLGIALTIRKGNKAVVLEYEDSLEPSQEPLASLLTQVTFGWANPIVWKGYKMTLEIGDVWNLIPKDKAANVLAHFRQVKKTSGLATHLLKHFKRHLLIQALWCMFSNIFTFLPTLLLKAILEYIETPDSIPVSAAWFYVTLLFVSGAIQAVADGQALWIGRRICIRLRAIIIGEIYAKSLRRKASAESTTEKRSDQEQESTPPSPTAPRPRLARRVTEKILSLGRRKNQDQQSISKTDPTIESSQVAHVGTIINLMAVDSFKVSEVSSYLHYLWASVPVQVVIAIYLLWRILGYSSIAGIVMMGLLLPINLVVAKQFSKTQKQIMTATDGRIHTTNEVLNNIRIIKYFAWEEKFGALVDEKRAIELKALKRRFILWALASTIWYSAPILITLSTFFIYTVVEKRDLIPSVAFTAISLFSLLRVPLDQLADMIAHVQESKVSVDRVEKFLNEEETNKYRQLIHDEYDENGESVIGLDHATLTWGSKDSVSSDGQDSAFRLINMDIKFKVGKLNVVAGPTGSGKTSLLMALLGEMSLVEGRVLLPGGIGREDMRPDPMTGLTESVAYCAQQAWLVNATIKQNIIFASPFDEARYRSVLWACALERDLDILDAGDQTLVGEKGIALSGGQKQRISLARALYSNSRHLLLDDCLSAVDSHTASHIFEHCITGPLMYNRTCILVTHNVSLCVPRSQYVIALNNGKVAAQGTPEEVNCAGVFGEDLFKSRPASEAVSGMTTRIQSNLEDVKVHQNGNGKKPNAAAGSSVNGAPNGKPNGADKQKEGKISAHLTEEKAAGKVKWNVIKTYLRAMGPWYFWVATSIAFIAGQAGSIATNVWIREWANAYQVQQKNTMTTFRDISLVGSYPGMIKSFVTGCSAGSPCAWNLPQFPKSSISITVVHTEVDVGYYLWMYAAIGFSYVLIAFLRELIVFTGSLAASRRIHRRLRESVMRAKFRFFDSTPLGQIMNRFSKDLESIDQEVAPIAIGWLHSAVAVAAVVILISIITPGFLIAGVFIGVIYYVIAIVYIDSSRDLKRLESVQRSPLYQQFGETLSGVVTIRAYGDEKRFVRDNQMRINTHNRPFIYMWATNRWLAFRVDMTGALVAFFAGAFVVLGVGKVDAGAAGLSLTYAITFTENVLWLVRLYSANEQNMNSVERVKEYLDVEQEAKAVISETAPPSNWPSKGSIEFINYSTRYRSDLDPVLRNLTFKIAPGERVGVVGRTGAGKSSLALAMFRALEADKGKILIDNVDIGLIGLQQLRESITMVPQDPTLFSGTIRSNLDPFGLFTDEEIFTALRRVYLIESPSNESPPITTSAEQEPNTTNEPSSSNDDASAGLGIDVDTNSPPLTKVMTNSGHDNKNIFLDLQSSVSESGSNLSQGQRQLLCLARALLVNPRVLLMDEATASIDYATDSKIQDTLRELKENTIITIAHRLQTIIDYDKVLVLDRGEVVEYGSSWELLKKEGGVFRGMCEMSGEIESLMEGARRKWEQTRLVDDS